MPTTLNDITNAASYKGEISLGGGVGFPLELDTSPVKQLAAYTVMYNKSQYDQRQKDADEKIKKLGALLPYDLVNGIEKDKNELKDAQAKLTSYMSEFASKGSPKSPDEKIQNELDFQKKIADQLKLINGANARKIKLDLYTDKIQADTKLSAAEKELRIKQAKDLFNNTDIYTVPDIPDHEISLPKNSGPVIETVNVLRETPNGMIDETKQQFSIAGNWKTSFLDGNNLNIPVLPENATEQQKAEYEQKKLAFSKTGIGAWQNAAEFYNQALNDPNYKKTITTNGINVVGEAPTTALTEEVDVERVKSSNPIVGGIVSLAERYNAYAAQRLEDIKNGYYIDNVTGEKILLTNGDKAEDIIFIDVTKPLKAEHLSFLEKFEKAAPDKVDKKFTSTDNQLQREQMANALKIKQLDEAGANYRARLAAASKGSGDKKEPEVINKPAELFLQHVERLKNKFKDNGNQSITTGFPGVDEKTRIATGIKENQSIVYNPDGSYEIMDKKGKPISKGLIENLAQGFIEAVKVSDIDRTKDKDGTMAEGFQRKSEERFKQVFGTTSGKTIWDSWSEGKTEPVTVTQTTTVTDGDSKLTDAEYFMKYKKARK